MNNNVNQKLKMWRQTIDSLSEDTGLSLREICEYTGATYNESGPSFYIKLPRKRSVFIGVGMALGQPIEVINEWITSFGGKKKLYAKDISEDLVWMYLINAAHAESHPDTGTGEAGESEKTSFRKPEINYYRKYEEFQSVAYAVFRERWDEIVMAYEDTADVEISLGQAEYGPEYKGIISFVEEHMDAFKTAYTKPRSFLDMYVSNIIKTARENPDQKKIKSLNSMRGYLDDSMINFLSGNSDTVNVIDRKTGKRTVNIKHVPKGRDKYIRLCLALGMTAGDINTYLNMMGYAELNENDRDEKLLIEALAAWEDAHPLQRLYKRQYFEQDESVSLSPEEQYRAVDEMLQLRSDLSEEYKGKGSEFPYSGI